MQPLLFSLSGPTNLQNFRCVTFRLADSCVRRVLPLLIKGNWNERRRSEKLSYEGVLINP